MSAPLLSVIIPTHNRPRLLSRAVDSALQSAPDGDLEVIVVPNGPDESWRAVAEKYSRETRVQWQPIALSHANIARNHGMQLATGEYIRFLDDDDYLYPDAAENQLRQLVASGADLSFGVTDKIDESSRSTTKLLRPNTKDYIAAALSPRHSTLTTALVYRRALTEGLKWSPSINKRQDRYWMISLCVKQELSCHWFNEPVGVWWHHHNPRVSQGHSRAAVARESAQIIISASKSLEAQNRLTEERASAAADYIWQCVHLGIMYDPVYWTRMTKVANNLAKDRAPDTPVHKTPIAKHINPLALELASIPIRWIRVLSGHKYSV